MSFADGAVENPKFELNTNTSVLTVTGAKGNVTIAYVIHGNIVTGSWADLTLTDNNGSWSASDVVCKAGEFGIKETTNGSQSNWYAAPSGQQNVGVGSTVTCTNSGPTNFSIGAGTYTFTFNASTKVLTITGEGSTVDPNPGPNPGTDKELYVTGNALGWAEKGTKMEHVEGTNVYTLTSSTLFADEWKINDGTWSWSFGMGDTLDAGKDNNCWYNGQNFSAIEGNVTIKFTLVAGSDVQDSSIPSILYYTIEGQEVDPTPNPGTDKELYITGNNIGWQEKGIKMDHVEGTNIYTLTSRDIFTDAWKINDGTWSWSFGMGDSLEPNVENDCWYNGQNFSAITLADDQNVVLTFTLVQGSDFQDSSVPSKVSYTITTGIESIEAENGAAQYYNLQGVRVANPENGVFIRIQNGKAVKVLK